MDFYCFTLLLRNVSCCVILEKKPKLLHTGNKARNISFQKAISGDLRREFSRFREFSQLTGAEESRGNATQRILGRMTSNCCRKF